MQELGLDLLIDAGFHLQVDAPRAAWLSSGPNRANRNLSPIPGPVVYVRQLRQFKILAARAVVAVSWCVLYKAILSEALAPDGIRVTTALALPRASMACALLGGGPVGITSNMACRNTSPFVPIIPRQSLTSIAKASLPRTINSKWFSCRVSSQQKPSV